MDVLSNGETAIIECRSRIKTLLSKKEMHERLAAEQRSEAASHDFDATRCAQLAEEYRLLIGDEPIEWPPPRTD
jgi:hypothetical protein